jgi:hypothetical protein
MKHKFVKPIERFLLIISAILIAVSMYFIGNMTALESQSSEIQIIYPDAIAIQSDKIDNNPENSKTNTEIQKDNIVKPNSNQSQIIASKNGKRYYYKNCGGINRIKTENRIYFETEQQAEAKGLTLASGCKKL